MALEECIQDSIVSKGKDSSVEKWNVSEIVADVDDNLPNGFECNICLDFVQDPVVTLCGHLYCWPCIYKWLHMESISAEVSDEQSPQCPVCKARVSETTLIPLYGRGNIEDGTENKLYPEPCIPPRPPPPASGIIMPEPISMTQPYFPELNFSVLGHPLVLMLNEMIQGIGFRSSSTNLSSLTRTSYMGQTDKSLSRLSFFLFCCILVCLMLF